MLRQVAFLLIASFVLAYAQNPPAQNSPNPAWGNIDTNLTIDFEGNKKVSDIKQQVIDRCKTYEAQTQDIKKLEESQEQLEDLVAIHSEKITSTITLYGAIVIAVFVGFAFIGIILMCCCCQDRNKY